MIAPLVSLILLFALAYNFKGMFLAATVNGQPISRLSLDRTLEKQSGKQALEGMVMESLILQEAKKKGVTASQQDIDQKTKDVEKQFTDQGQTLDSYLTSRGQTKQDFQNQLKTQILIEKMLGDKTQISDQEAKDYFDKNKSFLPKDATFDSQNDQIIQTLVQQKLSSAFQTWIQDAKNNAKINYFVSF